MMSRLALLACLACVLCPAAALYEKDSLVENLNPMNYNTHIKKQDSMNKVKLIEFYSESSASCKSFVKEYNELAKQLKGIITIAAVNCDKHKKICDDNGVTSHPTLKVIPPGGFGTQNYAGERNSKAIYSWVVKFMTHFVQKVNADNLDGFLNAQAGKFKALLFTDKPKTPLIWKGLSVDMETQMTLGEVKSSEKGVCARYKVTKFPTVLVVKPNQKKPIKFEGKIQYGELFEFLNRYQETFAMENLAADEEQALKKPWLSESFPELHALSAPDVCYNSDAVCVIAFTKTGADGKAPKEVTDAIMSAKTKYGSTGGAKFVFMWADAEKEAGYATALGVTNPGLVAMRTGKRTRFGKSEMENPLGSDSLGNFLDRVLGGDLQYKPLKEGPPALNPPPVEEKAEKKK
jgi:protein disulfide-isomerase A6